MRRVLITGANGFIGHHLTMRLIQEGYGLRLLIHQKNSPFEKQVKAIHGDITDARAMKTIARGCDVICHLAGKVHDVNEIEQDDCNYQAINVEGTRNLLEGAVRGGVRRFVFFSSVKAMGEETDQCLDESSIPCPLTAYGRSKLEAEKIVLHYGQRFGLETVCLRLPLVYGERNKGNLLRMIQAIDRGLFPPLGEVGNRRSMVHVTNVVEASLLAIRQPKVSGQCYIVSDGEAYTTYEIYRMILQALGKSVPHWHVPYSVLKTLGWIGDGIGRLRRRRFFFDSDAFKKLTCSAWYSSEKITRDLHYRPSVKFREALPLIIDWYQQNYSS